MRSGRWRRGRGDRGEASAEVVLATIPIMAMLFLVVFAGRWVSTSQDVMSASRDAARAAAVLQDQGRAVAAGRAAATDTLAGRSISCRGGPTVSINVSRLEPGGEVTATVSCVVDLGDVTGFGVPGSSTVSHSSTAVVDTYRGG